MNTLTVGTRQIELDKDGYLLDLADWSAQVADALAATEELQLSAEHWEILELLRGFYRASDASGYGSRAQVSD